MKPAHNRKNPSSRDQLTGPFIETAIRLGVLGLLLYWSLVLVSPFISIAIWSVVLTVALYPVFEWMTLRLGGRRRLAAILVTILSLLIVIGPATWLALGLIESLRTLSEGFDFSTLAIPPPSKTVKDWPLIGDPIRINFGILHRLISVLPWLKSTPNLNRWAAVCSASAQTPASVLLKSLLPESPPPGFLFHRRHRSPMPSSSFRAHFNPGAGRGVCRSSRSNDSGSIARCYWHFSSAGLACRCRADGCRRSSGEFDCFRCLNSRHHPNWTVDYFDSGYYLELDGDGSSFIRAVIHGLHDTRQSSP